MINDLNEISIESSEGRLLMAALAKITSESQTDKTPNEVIGQLNLLADKMFVKEQELPKHPSVISENGNELLFDKGGNLIKELPKQDVDKFEKFLDNEIEFGLSPKDRIERIKWYYQTYFKSNETLYTEEQLDEKLSKGMVKFHNWATGKDWDSFYGDYEIKINNIIQELKK